MKCPNCGKEITNDSRFCEYCGTKVSKPRSFKILWIILVIILCLAILGVGSFYIYDWHRQHVKEDAERMEIEVEADAEAESLTCDESDSPEDISELGNRVKISTQYSEWVDLGLPSGTLWKRDNENGYFTNEEAKELYLNRLPSIDQFTELAMNCYVEWTDDGLRLIGDNGQSIFFKSAGYKAYNDEIEELGSLISCYTCDPWWCDSSEPSEYLCLFRCCESWGSYNFVTCSPMEGNSVHLICKP